MRFLLVVILSLLACSKPSPSTSLTVKKGSRVEYKVFGPDSVNYYFGTDTNTTTGWRSPSIAFMIFLNSTESQITLGNITSSEAYQKFTAFKDRQQLKLQISPSASGTVDGKFRQSLKCQILVDGKVVREAEGVGQMILTVIE